MLAGGSNDGPCLPWTLLLCPEPFRQHSPRVSSAQSQGTCLLVLTASPKSEGVGGQPRPLQSTQLPARPGRQTHSHSVFTISYNKYSDAVRTTVATGWHVLPGVQVPAATGAVGGPRAARPGACVHRAAKGVPACPELPFALEGLTGVTPKSSRAPQTTLQMAPAWL